MAVAIIDWHRRVISNPIRLKLIAYICGILIVGPIILCMNVQQICMGVAQTKKKTTMQFVEEWPLTVFYKTFVNGCGCFGAGNVNIPYCFNSFSTI